MFVQSVDLSDLDRLGKTLNSLLREFPEKRRVLHDQLGTLAKREVDAGIGGSGKVQGWQEARVGSGGGYAAVSPMRGKFQTPNGEEYAYGQVTNAIESGHTQSPGRFVPKLGKQLKLKKVEGKLFYQSAEKSLESKVAQTVERFVDELAQKLEGSG